jgi:hypothetical protein
VERFWASTLTRFRDYLHGTDSDKMHDAADHIVGDGAIPARLDERAPDDPDH